MRLAPFSGDLRLPHGLASKWGGGTRKRVGFLVACFKTSQERHTVWTSRIHQLSDKGRHLLWAHRQKLREPTVQVRSANPHVCFVRKMSKLVHNVNTFIFQDPGTAGLWPNLHEPRSKSRRTLVLRVLGRPRTCCQERSSKDVYAGPPT